MSEMSRRGPPHEGLRVLFPDSEGTALVAGLPAALRSAHRAASELPGAKVIFCGEESAFQRRWKRQLEGLGASSLIWANGQPAAELLAAREPLLAVSPSGFPQPAALKAFVEKARSIGRAARWESGGRAVAVYWPEAASLLAGEDTAADVAQKALMTPAEPVQARGWLSAADEPAARLAARALYAELPRDTDGYLARLDRKVSIALSDILLRTPVTPNQITAASLLLGLLGAWGLASGSYWPALGGALLLWFCCILDGCDGEVARLKLLCSKSGAAFDLFADHLAHLATFVAIPIGIHRMDPAASYLLPGLLLVSGFAACMLSVWWLILRLPEERRGRYPLLIERVASRDYVYLILAFVAIGRLEWFLWAAAVGSHLFNAGLWWLSRAGATRATA